MLGCAWLAFWCKLKTLIVNLDGTEKMDSVNMFKSLIPPNLQYAMTYFGKIQLCNVPHATNCMGVCTNITIITSRMSHHIDLNWVTKTT